MRQINLLPEEIQKAQQQTAVRNAAVLTLAPIFFIVLVVHFLLSWQLQNVKSLAERSTDYIETDEAGEVKGAIVAMQAQIRDFFSRHEALLANVAQRAWSPVLLKRIGDLAEKKVWFTALTLDHQSGVCRIEGQSFNTRLVSEFMLELKKETFLKSVNLSSMEKLQEGKVDFLIVCQL